MKNVAKICLIILLVSSVAACATFGGWSRKPVYPTDLTGEMKQAFSVADQNYLSGNFAEAKNLYQQYISSYGYNKLTDEAKFKLGEIAFAKKKYSEALTYYKEAYGDLYNPEIAPKSQLKAAMALYKLKRYDQALSVLEEIKRKDASSVLALRADSLAVHTGKRLRYKRDGLIRWYLFLLDDYDRVSPEGLQKISEKLVGREVAQKEVSSWARDANVTKESVDALPFNAMKGKTSGGYVLYKLAMVNFSHGDIKTATRLLGKFVRGYPKHEFAVDGATLLAELKGKTSGKRLKLGVILPLSGRFGLYGNSTLHGIQCAAGLTPPCSSPLNVELIVKDSAGDPARAEEAVAQLSKERVLAIVGPLLSTTAKGAATKAQELHIPMVSLSQKDGVAEIGSFIYKHALTPQDQVNTLVEYVVGRRKKKNIGILHPSNSYGSHFASLFRSAVKSAGGKVVYQQRYSHDDLKAFMPSKPGRKKSEATIIGGVTEGMRGAYVEGMGKSFEVPEKVQALFIPDSYKAVRYVVVGVNSDSKKPASNLLFVGVNRWNNPGLVSHDIGLLNGSVFVDGFYKKSADVTTRNFTQNFQHAFGMDPTILEAQAFDAVKIIIAGVRDGGSSRAKLSSAIGRVKNLGGATGSINIDGSGNSRRRLFILTVKGGAIAELSSGRGLIKGADKNSTKSGAKKISNSKYGDGEVPSLTVRTDSTKYESSDLYSEELE
jgi:ABC-type branched-subunit amino acid transport system substrate-binding protein/predicted negative regulator of RcsB-dependent stress response